MKDTREFAVILLRRLFMQSASDDYRLIFTEADESVQREVGAKLIQLYDSERERKVRKYLGSALSTLAEFVFCAPDDDDNYQEANWPELIQVCMKACINKETE